jgi:hypothetical protein
VTDEEIPPLMSLKTFFGVLAGVGIAAAVGSRILARGGAKGGKNVGISCFSKGLSLVSLIVCSTGSYAGMIFVDRLSIGGFSGILGKFSDDNG